MRISASTPAGRLRFCRLSIVFGVAFVMSIRRLCVRISKASPPILYTCGDLTTVNVLRRVGSGTGPAISAPVRIAVSIICFADWSMTLWSYAFSRMRIRRPVEVGLSAIELISFMCNTRNLEPEWLPDKFSDVILITKVVYAK